MERQYNFSANREQNKTHLECAEVQPKIEGRAFKDSGIEWIGKIPKEWVTTSLKNTAKGKDCLFIDGDWIESPHITNSGYRYLTTGNVGPLKYKEQGESYISEDSFKALNCTQVYPGDLLIARLNEPIGRTCVVPNLDSPIVTAVDNVIYRPDEQIAQRCFMLYMLNCPGFTETANLMARGSTMHRLSRSMLGNLQIILPPLYAQKRIAKYLDKKCGEIEALIALQEQMIAQLTDYKQSVITEAVTKGLDPNATLVPSGIDWIGEMPKGWKVSQLKRFVSFQNGQDYKEIEVAKGFPVYGSGGIFAYASQYMYEGESILFGRKGTINRPLYINCKFWTVDTMYYTIPKKDVCAKFLYYVATTLPYDKYSTSTALPSMTQTILGNLKIAIPPKSEQRAIASYLDTKCSEIDSLIALKQQKIETLKEYKKSVIFESVTGKTSID